MSGVDIFGPINNNTGDYNSNEKLYSEDDEEKKDKSTLIIILIFVSLLILWYLYVFYNCLIIINFFSFFSLFFFFSFLFFLPLHKKFIHNIITFALHPISFTPLFYQLPIVTHDSLQDLKNQFPPQPLLRQK